MNTSCPTFQPTEYEAAFLVSHGEMCRSHRERYGRFRAALKRWVAERDGHTCRDCARTWPTKRAALAGGAAHHVVPVAEGGTDEPENLEFLCNDCHQGQHDFELPYLQDR